MATINIDGAQVFPEDVGTGTPSDYEQPESAGHLAGLAYHDRLSNYVLEDGLEFQPDYGTSTLDITAGGAHILVDNTVTVQSTVGGDHTETWHPNIDMVVNVPGVTGISLTSGATNHVFLAVDLNAGDGAYFEVNTTDEQPTDPYVKIGTVDTDAGTADDSVSRGPDLATSTELENAESNISTLDSRVSTAESEIDTLQSDMSTAQSDISSVESDLSSHESNGNHDEISGGVVGRSSPITHLAANIWEVPVGDPVPSGVEEGDLIFRY